MPDQSKAQLIEQLYKALSQGIRRDTGRWKQSRIQQTLYERLVLLCDYEYKPLHACFPELPKYMDQGWDPPQCKEFFRHNLACWPHATTDSGRGYDGYPHRSCVCGHNAMQPGL